MGLLDADVYGPSIPIMLGLRRLTPPIEHFPDGKEKVVPYQIWNSGHFFGILH